MADEARRSYSSQRETFGGLAAGHLLAVSGAYKRTREH